MTISWSVESLNGFVSFRPAFDRHGSVATAKPPEPCSSCIAIFRSIECTNEDTVKKSMLKLTVTVRELDRFSHSRSASDFFTDRVAR